MKRLFVFLLFVMLSGGLFCQPSMIWWTNDCGGSVVSRGDSIQGFSAGLAGFVRTRGLITRLDAQLGYWVPPFVPQICLELSPDAWSLGGVDVRTTTTMEDGDEIAITNCSNTHVALGLQYSHSEPDAWRVSYFVRHEQCVVRCRFTTGVAPIIYYSTDLLTNDIVWADAAYYGPMGDLVEIGDSIKLFMQFEAPFSTTSFDEPQTIYINLTVKTIMP